MKQTPKDLIIKLPDPRLRKPSRKISHIDHSTKELADLMVEATLDWEASRKHEFGAALAAVQLGKLYRVIIIRRNFEDKEAKDFKVLINPEIVKYEGEPVEAMEGCLSVKDLYGSVPRYPKVKVKGTDINGKPVRITATGFLARVMQHEIDHTNGKLFIDRVKDPSKLYRLDAKGEFIHQPETT
ncbi:MAG TPA: peptide deformylase [Candidatus Dormibacteraeota bacterium]|nr:peptide deformylase [Candidatus Dormibacteraeota bacterium]